MNVIVFKLKEAQAKYEVSGKDLSEVIGVNKSTVSEWRSGKKSPSLERLDAIMEAFERLANPEKLKLYPLELSELVEWRSNVTLSGVEAGGGIS